MAVMQNREVSMESEENWAQEADEKAKAARVRFEPNEYQEDYVSIESSAFKDQVHKLYSMIDAYKKHYKDSSWTECCYTFERRVPRGSLGHPKDKTIRVSTLILREGINSENDLAIFLKKTLPKNSKGEIRLPRCNMRHPSDPPVRPSNKADPFPWQQKQLLEDKVLELMVQVDELTRENENLNRKMEGMKWQARQDETDLRDAVRKLEERQEKTDGILSAYLIKILDVKKENRELREADQRRHQDHKHLLGDMWKLLALVDEHSDQLDKLKSTQEKKPHDSFKPGKRYDPECLDAFSLNWQSLEQPPNSYRSPLSQLMSLKKRAPETK